MFFIWRHFSMCSQVLVYWCPHSLRSQAISSMIQVFISFVSCIQLPVPFQCPDSINNPAKSLMFHKVINTLRPRQNGRPIPDDIFKYIFLNENAQISIKISLKFVPKGPIYNIPVLVQIMAWRRPGAKPLSQPMMFNLIMHICVTRPQWVKHLKS